MGGWPTGELRKIAETDDLHIAPFRDDGASYGTPTWISSVAVDGALHVHACNGVESAGAKPPCARKAAGLSQPA